MCARRRCHLSRPPLGTFGDAGAFSLQFNKIITTGGGGVLITDRDDLLELALDVHDCANSVPAGVGCRSSRGYNFRAFRADGAMARVQLTRPRRLAESGCGRIMRRLASQVGGLPGLELRRGNDDDGDAGIALIAFADDAARAADAVAALNAEAARDAEIYSPATPDLTVFSLLGSRSRGARGRRWRTAGLPAHAELLERDDPRGRSPSAM